MWDKVRHAGHARGRGGIASPEHLARRVHLPPRMATHTESRDRPPPDALTPVMRPSELVARWRRQAEGCRAAARALGRGRESHGIDLLAAASALDRCADDLAALCGRVAMEPR